MVGGRPCRSFRLKRGAPAAASEQYTALEPNAKKKATFTVNDKEEASKKIQAIIEEAC